MSIQISFKNQIEDHRLVSTQTRLKLILSISMKHFCNLQNILHTVKLKAVDWATIQFWNLLAKGHSK
jgi:hypothetical protein